MGKYEKSVIAKLNALVREKGSRQAVADHLGISLILVSSILQGRRRVSNKLAKKLGFRRVIMFEEIRS